MHRAVKSRKHKDYGPAPKPPQNMKTCAPGPSRYFKKSLFGSRRRCDGRGLLRDKLKDCHATVSRKDVKVMKMDESK